MTIFPVKAFQDNYIWLLQHDKLPQVVIVDPGQAAPVLTVLTQRQLQPLAILITHHHADHIGGINGILAQYPQLPVFGPADTRIPQITQRVQGGDRVPFPTLNLMLEVLAVPGHTASHIAYYADNCLFCGDTLFSAGCGRIFDGSLAQLHQSLTTLAALPGSTAVYCAHEYTLDNIGFAKWVEPDNSDLLAREAQAEALQQAGQPTIPTTIAQELATNPFLRSHLAPVIQAAERYAQRPLPTPVEVFSVLRQWKDTAYD